MSRSLQHFLPTSSKSLAGLALVCTAAAVAAWVEYRSRRAKQQNPPEGQLIDVDGERLRYVEWGQGLDAALIAR